MKKFKRGDKVRVVFEGTVISASDDAVRVSVKKPELQESWWAVVPAKTIKHKK